jgi:hypothetical protein
MIRIITYLFVLSCSTSVYAQQSLTDPSPTHWLNYSQLYYKIPIAQDGIYRITTAELSRAGIPVNQIDPTTIQLFHRGIEQAIYVAGETDHHFGSTDFLEFYGQRNDGAQDSLLYKPASAQPHRYYSLFSDTTAYFLTWRLDGQPGKRMAAYTDSSYASLTPDRYHWEEDLRLFTDNYPGWAAGIPPKVETSYYDAGEGYTGLIQTKDKPFHTTFQLTNAAQINAITSLPTPQVDILLVGRDFINHRVDCLAGPAIGMQRQLDSIRFSVYNNARSQQNLAWTNVSSDGKLVISTVSKGETTIADNYSVSYIRLRYPQQLTANQQPQRTFRLTTNATGKSLLNITDVLPNTRFWDISEPTTPVQIGITSAPPGTARMVVQHTQTARTILSSCQPKTVLAIIPVSFINWTTRRPTYLIISHEALMQPVGNAANAVKAYADYRASAAGGRHDTLIVTMQQLIDQFSYGERHPLAIRRFIDQMLRQSKGSAKRPQYLLLLGRSRSTPGVRRDPNQASLDLVMTGGFPGSDVVFTAGLDGYQTDVPAIPTGRINAGSPQDVLNYLAKVKEYESQQTNTIWRKNLLHLSGGETANEITLLRQLVDGYRNQARGQSLGARVTTLSKTAVNSVEQGNVAKSVNEGVGLITFFGHSGIDVTDLNIGLCSVDSLGYRNKGKYPLLLVNGCAIGNFFYGRPTLVTDWVLTPNRGAIAAIAHSHLGYTDLLHFYSSTFYSLLSDSTQLTKSIGQLQQETIRRVLAQTDDPRTLANAQQMVLQGDPAIRLFPFETPDYSLSDKGLTISGTDSQPLTTLSDSVQIHAIVRNSGQYRIGQLPIRIRRLVNRQETAIFNQVLPYTVAFSDTLTITIPNDRNAKGLNQFEVTVNPTDSPAYPASLETNHTNNRATISVNVTITGLSDGSQPSMTVYPNPFRDQIRFSLCSGNTQFLNKLTLILSDLKGRTVRKLIQTGRAGIIEWTWDGCADSGESLPTGIYIYKLTADDHDGSGQSLTDNQNRQLSGRIVLIR